MNRISRIISPGLKAQVGGFVRRLTRFIKSIRSVWGKKSRVISPYLETLFVELVGGLARYYPLYLFLLIVLWVRAVDIGRFNGIESRWIYYDIKNNAKYWAMVIAYANVIASLLAKTHIGSGGFWTRFVLGARDPSTRELEGLNLVLQQAVVSAQMQNITVKTFRRFYVVDSLLAYANVVGSTLYISSGAFNSPHFQTLVVHELAHLHHGDGRQILSLRRLVSPLFQIFVGDVRNFSTSYTSPSSDVREFDPTIMRNILLNKITFFLLALFGGGVGVYVLSWRWANYFRARDYLADAFVARLGYKDALLEYLEQNKFYDNAVPYMLSWRPASELRIDALLHPEVYGISADGTRGWPIPRLPNLLTLFERLRAVILARWPLNRQTTPPEEATTPLEELVQTSLLRIVIPRNEDVPSSETNARVVAIWETPTLAIPPVEMSPEGDDQTQPGHAEKQLHYQEILRSLGIVSMAQVLLTLSLPEVFIGCVKRLGGLKFTVPPGLVDGCEMLVQSFTNRMRVLIKTGQDGLFVWDGVALRTKVTLTADQARLGGEFPVLLPDMSECEVVIPANTQLGDQVCVPGHGMPVWYLEGVRSDLVVEIQQITD